MYVCFNAFKEKGRIYNFNDEITEEEYDKISPRNQVWFFKKSAQE